MTIAIKCSNPKCKEVFLYDNNRVPGEINDRYSISLKCKKCGATTSSYVYNVSYLWQTDEFEVIKSEESNESPLVINSEMAAIEGLEDVNKPLHKWKPSNSPLWCDKKCNYELTATIAFRSCQDPITKTLWNWDQGRLKSMHFCEFNNVIIRQTYKVGRRKCEAIWYKEIGNDLINGPEDFYLIHHSNAEYKIDGIYTRDQSLLYLERLLVRWRALCSEVIVATPFIGYNFPFSKKEDREELLALWDLLNGLLDMDKTIFFTRPQTYSSLKKNQNIIEKIPAKVRKEWGLMSNLQKIVDNPRTRAKMKKNFHLKIYVGVFDNHVEMYSGSFNVQKNSTMENMVIRNLRKELFKENYMNVMVDGYDFRKPQKGSVLLVDVSQDKVVASRVVSTSEINNIISRTK